MAGIAANKPVGLRARIVYFGCCKIIDYIPYPVEMGLVLPFSSTYSFGQEWHMVS